MQKYANQLIDQQKHMKYQEKINFRGRPQVKDELPEIKEQDDENGGSSFYARSCYKPVWNWDEKLSEKIRTS